jgi:CHAT domain-containing protein
LKNLTSFFSLLFFFFLLATSDIAGQTSGLQIFDQAEKSSNEGNFRLSNDKYFEAIPLFFKEKNWPKYYQSRYAITYNYVDLYEFEKAEKEITSAISHFEKNYQDTFIIQQPKLYHAAGRVYIDLHKYEEAIANNRLAMKYYQGIKNEKSRIKYTSYMYNNIGGVYKQKRSMDSALHYFQLALPLKTQALGPNANSTLRTIKSISGIYQDWGQLDKAIKTQTIALDGAIKEGNKNAEAEAYNGLSQMYQRKYDFETSKKYIAKSMETYKAIVPQRELDIARSYHQMGNVLEAEKSHQESIQWYTNAKKLYRKIYNGKYSYKEGLSTMNLGKAYNYLADQLEESSLKIDADHPDVRKLRAKSIVFFDENEEIFKEVISKDHARWIELWLSKGLCLIENRDTSAAHELFQKAYDRAYKVSPEKSYDRSLACLNLARSTINPDSALALYQSGLWELSNNWEYESYADNPTAKQSFYEDWSVEIMLLKVERLTDLYRHHNNLQYLEDGIKTMVAADRLMQETRASFLTTSAKILLGNRGHDIYAKGVELCHILGHKESLTFDFIEKNKGLVLLEALHHGESIRNLMVPDSISSELRRLNDHVDELTAQQNQLKESDRLPEISAIIYDLEKERNLLKESITKAYPITERITNEGLIVNLETVQKSLKRNEVIYEYLETTNELYILKIESKKSELYKVDNIEYQLHLDSLLYLINDVAIAKNKSNSKKVWTQYQRHAYQLFNKLLPDYQQENLLIIPDGGLNYLPFELLLTDNENIDQINYSLLPYLLKSGIIKYAFSSTLHFANLDLPHPDQNQLLAIAPTYPIAPSGLLASRAGFSALKHIESEARSISDIMEGKKLLGKDATVANFKSQAADFEVLHLAMHAYTHDEDPMLSGMIFSETADGEDNVLHAYELYNMSIPSKMVVLSACNTGLGQHEQGEGVMSLGRAFRHAGTKSIIMSLWQADDETTSEIMTSFYTSIKDGAPKAEALRNAKLSYLERGSNVFPHFWGSFVLLGDNTPLRLGDQSPVLWMFLIGIVMLIAGIWNSKKVEVKSKN